MNASAEFSTLLKAGCLMNPDLYGLGIDATIPACRSLIWTQFLKPRCGMNASSELLYMRKINFKGACFCRYYDQGISAYWLDETDGEGSNAPGDGAKNTCSEPLCTKTDRVTKTGSG